MKTATRVSTPTRPLAALMRHYASEATRFDAASAFLSAEAVMDVVQTAVDAGAQVRLLTGTFGNNTRKRTFEMLLKMSHKSTLETRVWDWNGRGDFHAKLYLWDLGARATIAWIGSANFTRGGLQNEGELVFEMRGKNDSASIRQLRAAFVREWSRARPLDAAFVSKYKEAAHPAPDGAVLRPRPGRVPRTRNISRAPFHTLQVTRHYSEESAGYKRIEALLGGTADFWLRASGATVSRARVGDLGVIVDHVDKDAALIHIVDKQRDGKGHVLAYEPVWRDGWVNWTSTRARKARAATNALPSRRAALGNGSLNAERFGALVRVLYPRRRLPAAIRARFEA